MQGACSTPILLLKERGHFRLAHGIVQGMHDIEVKWHFVVLNFSPRRGEAENFRSRLSKEWSEGRRDVIEKMTPPGETLPYTAETKKLVKAILMSLLA